MKKHLLGVVVLLSSVQAIAQDNSSMTAPKHDGLPASIIAIAPVQSTENGWGLGLSYERMLDKCGILSFYGNFYTSFNTQTNNGGTAASIYPMYYLSPGLKLYPTSNKGKVKYAVGPSFVVASGQERTYDYIGYGTYKDENRFTLGVLVNNSVNFSPSEHIYAALEFGFGWSYINTLGGTATDQKGLMQFAFKIGYRY